MFWITDFGRCTKFYVDISWSVHVRYVAQRGTGWSFQVQTPSLMVCTSVDPCGWSPELFHFLYQILMFALSQRTPILMNMCLVSFFLQFTGGKHTRQQPPTLHHWWMKTPVGCNSFVCSRRHHFSPPLSLRNITTIRNPGNPFQSFERIQRADVTHLLDWNPGSS